MGKGKTKRDCCMYNPETMKCVALTELVCEKKTCSFFKTKARADIDRFAAIGIKDKHGIPLTDAERRFYRSFRRGGQAQ